MWILNFSFVCQLSDSFFWFVCETWIMLKFFLSTFDLIGFSWILNEMRSIWTQNKSFTTFSLGCWNLFVIVELGLIFEGWIIGVVTWWNMCLWFFGVFSVSIFFCVWFFLDFCSLCVYFLMNIWWDRKLFGFYVIQGCQDLWKLE